MNSRRRVNSTVRWLLITEVTLMREIEVHGTFYETRGWSGKPVIYVDSPDDDALRDWRRENDLFTNWLEAPHPRTGENVPVLYPSPRIAKRFDDGESVLATLDVRSDRRGNGMKFVDVMRPSR
jgi:hypothetical protein